MWTSGDLLDYLSRDLHTRDPALREAITGARKFLSAARAAARNKPVIVVKASATRKARRLPASHTGALAGSDDVYDAALPSRRHFARRRHASCSMPRRRSHA